MFLEKIELVGFKSFYQKTTIQFKKNPKTDQKPKITAIVGPNGAGKSNVSDALKWALGVQKRKNYRSSKSTDVIFMGSSKKKPLSHARVSLFFNNSSQRIPIDFREVAVTRKIFLNGENEYLINDAAASVKEIVKLLSRSGIGRENFSIIDQGMADRLIVLNGEERKKVIEEVSKVNHLEIQKNDSIKKLINSLKNLQKAEELKQEIKPRLEELKKEVGKLDEKEKLLEELTKLVNLYYGIKIQKIDEKIQINSNQKKKNRDRLNSLEKEIQKLEDAINRASKENTENENKIELINNKKFDLNRQRNELSKQISVLEGKIELFEERIEFLKHEDYQKVDLDFVQKSLRDLLNKIDFYLSKKEVLKDDLLIVKQILNKLFGQTKEGKIIKKNNPEIRSREAKINSYQKDLAQKKNDLAALEKEDKELSRDLSALKDKEESYDIFKLQNKINNLNREKEEVSRTYSNYRIEMARLEERKKNLLQEIPKELNFDPQPLEAENLKESEFENYRIKIEKIKNRLNYIQEIDQDVVSKYQEVKKKYDHLQNEALDIREAVKALKKIIQKLEVKISSRFSKTFNNLNRFFNFYFGQLFNGGRAELIKVYQKDENSGKKELKAIDIEVEIPGKKVKRTEMLSGGEKTMTSLALLFSMIKTAKPPFVFLDEVDASLDEINSDNFAKILKTVALETQIVIITHNREVMSEAEVLYGISMGKDGVSKVISVELES
ncbi:MAG: AAA family ATPase [Candidatus Moranbacteria bacterium]|nr:AAA family ATPase [Candidatus Moranbacteria bacterium]